MEIFGVSLQTVYLYGLIISGAVTFLFILFHDVFSGFELPDIFNPTLVFSFFTLFFATAFLFTWGAGLHEWLVASLSFVISLIMVTLLNLFILIPISTAEESLAFTEDDLQGRVGRVLTAVPVDGFGEVLIESNSGNIAKPAASYNNEAIPFDTKVLVIEVKEGVLYVIAYKQI
ncbi:hypothetical protein [Peribacillus sp. Hz7]|uniref:hypothetical protein n=1 Tax=Peribacillus sp. Hz7 TaxID=3344873 RepID=UPI0035CAA654